MSANIDFLICDDVCVPEKANIKSIFENLEETLELKEWISKVPNTIYPVLGNQTKEFLEIRFSYNNKIENIYYFSENQNIVLHSGKQVLIKEDNNWLLKIPLQPENNQKSHQ